MGIKRRSGTDRLPFLSSSFPNSLATAPFTLSLPIPSKPTSAPSRLTVIASEPDTKHYYPSPPHPKSPLINVVCLKHPLLPPAPSPQDAFDSDPPSLFSSLPSSCNARKVTLLFSTHASSSIHSSHRLATTARVKREHLGSTILDVGQLRGQRRWRFRKFKRRCLGH